MTISPAIYDVIQDQVTVFLNHALATVETYAVSLFALFATLEVVFLGFAWALKRNEMLGDTLLTLLKIAAILYVVTQYNVLLNVLIQGFSFIGVKVAGASSLNFLAHPLTIWQSGYDACMQVISVAFQFGSWNSAASNLYLILGFGSLFLLGLIGAQLIFVNAAFYMVALAGLLMVPMATFKPMSGLLNQTVRHLFMAGIRVMVMVILMGVASHVLSQMGNVQLTQGDDITPAIGLFFCCLVFALLSYRLPEVAARAVGYIRFQEKGGSSSVVTVGQSAVGGGSPVQQQTSLETTQALAAATQLSPDRMQHETHSEHQATALAAQVSVDHASAPNQASQLSPRAASFSLKQIQQGMKTILQEKTFKKRDSE